MIIARCPFREIDGRQVAELWGNLVGRAFYEGLRHINTLQEIRTTRAPLLIVYGTEDEAVSATSVEGATRLLAEAGVAHEVVAIDGADHIFMRYEWEREAIDRTVDWLCYALSVEA
jgi:dienelactone hydrolase